VRSSRGLSELLGVDVRTVNYYAQAAEWLGLLDRGAELCLSSSGLEFAYAGDDRAQVYARAVRAQPFIQQLLAEHDGQLPATTDLAVAIAEDAPHLAASTALRRAGAIRSLVAPALKLPAPPRSALVAQLSLPLGLAASHAEVATLHRDDTGEYDPDTYRFLLCALLDHGELSLANVRALLDGAGGGQTPISGYLKLAERRGDATRTEERLIVTPDAIAHRDLAQTTTALLLSDPEYRADLERRIAPPSPTERRPPSPFAAWDVRLFGHACAPDALAKELDRVLLDRSLASFPRRGASQHTLPPVDAPFLDVWMERGLVFAAPPWLGQLRGGVATVNQALRVSRQGGGDVRPPDLADRPRSVHGGLLHPSEPPPRSVPDTRSLRIRLLAHAPWPALIAAALLVHRHQPDRCSITHEGGAWVIARRRVPLGTVWDVLEGFAEARGWRSCRRRSGGLGLETLLDALEAVGVLTRVGVRVVLAEPFFAQLRRDAEEMELHAMLQPLSNTLADYLDGLPTEPLPR